MNFIAILDSKFSSDVATVLVKTATIRSPKDVSVVMKHLGKFLPIPNLSHLKRVKRTGQELSVVVNYACQYDEKIVDSPPLKDVLLSVQEAIVPAHGPKTRAQYEKCMELWPVNFHPEKTVEKLLSSEVFSSEEQEWHDKCMKMVMAKAQDKGKSAALVADPKNLRVVATGHQQKDRHPLLHATMDVIDNVAATQRSPDDVSKPSIFLPHDELCAGGYSLVTKSLEASCGQFQNERSPIDPVLNEEAAEEIGDLLMGQKWKHSIDDKGLPYLCTGWDVYLSHEPCPMCAMALVHSRANRVFFAERNVSIGALVSCCQLQFIKDLNHHYQVFEAKPTN